MWIKNNSQVFKFGDSRNISLSYTIVIDEGIGTSREIVATLVVYGTKIILN